jgi:hypothetical protein
MTAPRCCRRHDVSERNIVKCASPCPWSVAESGHDSYPSHNDLYGSSDTHSACRHALAPRSTVSIAACCSASPPPPQQQQQRRERRPRDSDAVAAGAGPPSCRHYVQHARLTAERHGARSRDTRSYSRRDTRRMTSPYSRPVCGRGCNPWFWLRLTDHDVMACRLDILPWSVQRTCTSVTQHANLLLYIENACNTTSSRIIISCMQLISDCSGVIHVNSLFYCEIFARYEQCSSVHHTYILWKFSCRQQFWAAKIIQPLHKMFNTARFDFLNNEFDDQLRWKMTAYF